jgi:protein-S-isoprenylcysteine O-methyltransferase Ste14
MLRWPAATRVPPLRINCSPDLALFAVAVAAGLHFQILQEERFLRRNYAPEYEAYTRVTSRYLGWWKSQGDAC